MVIFFSLHPPQLLKILLIIPYPDGQFQTKQISKFCNTYKMLRQYHKSLYFKIVGLPQKHKIRDYITFYTFQNETNSNKNVATTKTKNIMTKQY